MSWIAIEDLVRAVVHAIDREDLSGPVNTVSPSPVTNAGFTAALGRALHRPTPFPVPAFALRALLGEMANELLLSSQRAEPARLQASGFSYRHPNLEEALRAALA
jgi:NAD dependent epimerase/dehydratase family enzyme